MKMLKYRRLRAKFCAVLILSIILISICGAGYAKYINQQKYTGTVTLKAELGTIVLREHKAVRQDDGSYVLLDEGECAEEDVENIHEHVTSNSYILIPGLDVPKDPHVVITKENDLPVYIYIEVIDKTESDKLTYTISKEWEPLLNEGNQVTTSNGGLVYVYKDALTASAIIHIFELEELKGGRYMTVSQGILSDLPENPLLINAYMYQTASGTSKLEVFNNQ